MVLLAGDETLGILDHSEHMQEKYRMLNLISIGKGK